MSSNVKRFIVLGDSGAGKSSFVNAFYNYCYSTRDVDDVFGEDQNGIRLAIPCANWLDRVQGNEKSSERDINDQTKSQTMNCTVYKLRFDNLVIELMDTPGFNDVKGVSTDDAVLCQIEKMLRSIPFLSGIIIVANGSTARLGTSFAHFMRLLHEVWPNSLAKNICAVLTNCDETTCSFSSQILHADLKVNETTTFHLQNSLFRWDRTTRTSKVVRYLRRDFEDTVATLDQLALTLARFDNISTEAFKIGKFKQEQIQDCISTSIKQIIALLKVNRLQEVATEGLREAKTTMANNTNWTKSAKITAFKWMEVEPLQSLQSARSTNDSRSILHTDNRYETPSLVDSTTHRFHALEIAEHDESSAKMECDEGSSLQYSRNSLHKTMPIDHSHGSFDIKKKSDLSNVDSIEHRPMRLSENHNGADKSSYGSNFDNYSSQTQFRPPRQYQRQDMKLQVTLHDNEAKSHHETARYQAKVLRKEAIKIANKREELLVTMESLIDELEDNVRGMRKINADIDLLERNKKLIEELRNEINLGGDEPKMIVFFNTIVQIVSKPTAR